jgi:hypothetical protein
MASSRAAGDAARGKEADELRTAAGSEPPILDLQGHGQR